MREGLDTPGALNRCVTLPWEIAHFIVCSLRRECHARGCVALLNRRYALRKLVTSRDFEVKQYDGLHGVRNASAHMDSRIPSQRIQRSLPGVIEPSSLLPMARHIGERLLIPRVMPGVGNVDYGSPLYRRHCKIFSAAHNQINMEY